MSTGSFNPFQPLDHPNEFLNADTNMKIIDIVKENLLENTPEDKKTPALVQEIKKVKTFEDLNKYIEYSEADKPNYKLLFDILSKIEVQHYYIDGKWKNSL